MRSVILSSLLLVSFFANAQQPIAPFNQNFITKVSVQEMKQLLFSKQSDANIDLVNLYNRAAIKSDTSLQYAELELPFGNYIYCDWDGTIAYIEPFCISPYKFEIFNQHQKLSFRVLDSTGKSINDLKLYNFNNKLIKLNWKYNHFESNIYHKTWSKEYSNHFIEVGEFFILLQKENYYDYNDYYTYSSEFRKFKIKKNVNYLFTNQPKYRPKDTVKCWGYYYKGNKEINTAATVKIVDVSEYPNKIIATQSVEINHSKIFFSFVINDSFKSDKNYTIQLFPNKKTKIPYLTYFYIEDFELDRNSFTFALNADEFTAADNIIFTASGINKSKQPTAGAKCKITLEPYYIKADSTLSLPNLIRVTDTFLNNKGECILQKKLVDLLGTGVNHIKGNIKVMAEFIDEENKTYTETAYFDIIENWAKFHKNEDSFWVESNQKILTAKWENDYTKYTEKIITGKKYLLKKNFSKIEIYYQLNDLATEYLIEPNDITTTFSNTPNSIQLRIYYPKKIPMQWIIYENNKPISFENSNDTLVNNQYKYNIKKDYYCVFTAFTGIQVRQWMNEINTDPKAIKIETNIPNKINPGEKIAVDITVKNNLGLPVENATISAWGYDNRLYGYSYALGEIVDDNYKRSNASFIHSFKSGKNEKPILQPITLSDYKNIKKDSLAFVQFFYNNNPINTAVYNHTYQKSTFTPFIKFDSSFQVPICIIDNYNNLLFWNNANDLENAITFNKNLNTIIYFKHKTVYISILKNKGAISDSTHVFFNINLDKIKENKLTQFYIFNNGKIDTGVLFYKNNSYLNKKYYSEKQYKWFKSNYISVNYMSTEYKLLSGNFLFTNYGLKNTNEYFLGPIDFSRNITDFRGFTYTTNFNKFANYLCLNYNSHFDDLLELNAYPQKWNSKYPITHYRLTSVPAEITFPKDFIQNTKPSIELNSKKDVTFFSTEKQYGIIKVSENDYTYYAVGVDSNFVFRFSGDSHLPLGKLTIYAFLGDTACYIQQVNSEIDKTIYLNLPTTKANDLEINTFKKMHSNFFESIRKNRKKDSLYLTCKTELERIPLKNILIQVRLNGGYSEILTNSKGEITIPMFENDIIEIGIPHEYGEKNIDIIYPKTMITYKIEIGYFYTNMINGKLQHFEFPNGNNSFESDYATFYKNDYYFPIVSSKHIQSKNRIYNESLRNIEFNAGSILDYRKVKRTRYKLDYRMDTNSSETLPLPSSKPKIEIDSMILNAHLPGIYSTNFNMKDSVNKQPINIRKNFKFNAYLFPFVNTDKNGKATINIQFPDDITTWKNNFLVKSKDNYLAYVRTNTIASKLLTAEIISPRSAILGDVFSVFGSINNFSEDSINVQYTWKKNGIYTVTNSQKIGNNLRIPLQVEAKTLDSIFVEFSSIAENKISDGELRAMEVLPAGFEVSIGRFKLLKPGDSIHFPDTSFWNVSAVNSGTDFLRNKLINVLEDPYECNEQLASKIQAAITLKQLDSTENKKFRYEKKIKHWINKLLANQHPNGSFSWWHNYGGNVEITFLVCKSMIKVSKAGYKIDRYPKIVLDALQFLTSHSQTKVQIMKIDYLNYLMHGLKPKIHNLYNSQLLNEEERMWYELCNSIYSNTSDEKYLLSKTKKSLLGNIYYSNTGFQLYNNEIDLSLMLAEIFKTTKKTNLYESVFHFFLEKYGTKNSLNTYQILCFADVFATYLNSVSANLNPLLQNEKGEHVAENFPMNKKIKASVIYNTGNSNIYIDVYKNYWKIPLKNANNGFETTLNWNDNTFTLGKKITANLHIKPNGYANYAMITVPIPAGLSIIHKTQYSGMHIEYLHNKINIYADAINDSGLSLNFNFFCKYPGNFIQNPTLSRLMYFPTINGFTATNSILIK